MQTLRARAFSFPISVLFSSETHKLGGGMFWAGFKHHYLLIVTATAGLNHTFHLTQLLPHVRCHLDVLFKWDLHMINLE